MKQTKDKAKERKTKSIETATSWFGINPIIMGARSGVFG